MRTVAQRFPDDYDGKRAWIDVLLRYSGNVRLCHSLDILHVVVVVIQGQTIKRHWNESSRNLLGRLEIARQLKLQIALRS